MLISDKLGAEIIKQIGRELGASNQYLCIAAYFDAETLPELASFFYRQSVEEREHALKFAKFIVEAGGRVAVPAVEAARADIGSAEAAVKLSVDWEMEVTRQINALLDLDAAGEGSAGHGDSELVRGRTARGGLVDGGSAGCGAARRPERVAVR